MMRGEKDTDFTLPSIASRETAAGGVTVLGQQLKEVTE
jgi:hypothetical protein